MAAIKGKLVVGTVMLSCFSVAAQAQAPAPLWTFDADAPIRSSPAIVPDGTIYFGAYGTLYAITNRGSNAWEFPTHNARDCSPAVAADGTIYYSSMTPGSPGSGYLYAISAKGTEKWRYPSQGGNGSPAIAADGTIYTTGGYYVHAVSPEGTNRWKYPIEGGDYSSFVSPTVEQDGSLCVGSIDSRAYYFLTMFGGLVSSFSLAPSGPGDSSAVGNDGTVYFTGRPLYAFSPNGTNLWASQTNSFEGSSPATGKDGTIYVATSGSSLCAFSPTGEFKWQVLTNGAIRGVTRMALS